MKKENKKWFKVSGITALFIATFFGLRAIPISECQFLHYEPTENALPGSDEMCSVAPVPFVDVAATPHPVRLEVHDLRSLESGQMELTFSLLGPDDQFILPHDLAITHTRRIHFMLIDEKLGSYHHLHPEALGDSGDYRVTFVPRSEHYRYFAEFVPLQTRLLSVADGTLDVDPADVIEDSMEVPIAFDLRGIDEPLQSNRDHRLRLHLESKDSEKPLPLEETMDAYAHLVGFEETLSGYAHMHPLTVDPEIGQTTELEFLFHPTRSGNFRIWVQIKANGEDIFRPFDVKVI